MPRSARMRRAKILPAPRRAAFSLISFCFSPLLFLHYLLFCFRCCAAGANISISPLYLPIYRDMLICSVPSSDMLPSALSYWYLRFLSPFHFISAMIYHADAAAAITCHISSLFAYFCRHTY